MKITIVGGHGKIAMLSHPLLKKAGHEVRAIIRKEEQADEIQKAGAEPVICDVEKESDISEAVGNVDAVIFAAGAGPGSGADRKWSVDRDGAIKLIKAAQKNGISRYIMISAMGLDKPRGSDVFQIYLKAKAEADQALKESGLDYTIIKPGKLIDDQGSGKIKVGQNLDRGEISRQDVARTLVAVLENKATNNLEFDLLNGEHDIETALQSLN